MFNYNKKAQAVTEYLIIIGLVMAALTVMSPVFKRGMQAAIKVTADQLGRQNRSDLVEDAAKGGFLARADVYSNAFSCRVEDEYNTGSKNYLALETASQYSVVNFVEGRIVGDFTNGD